MMQIELSLAGKSKWLVAIFLLMGIVVLAQQGTAESDSPRLFIEVERDLIAAVDIDEGAFEVLRERPVMIDPAVLASRSATDGWEINLFEDTVITAVERRVDRYEDGTSVWVGDVVGEPLSDVSLALNDAGMMVGSFNTAAGLYKIRPLGEDGVHLIQDVSYANAVELEPLVPEEQISGFMAGDAGAAVADDGSVIDVMVLYTPSARASMGGTAAIQALINLAISETNTGYDTSGVLFDLNLVHRQEVSYTESASSTDLSRLQGTADGFIDTAHSLRNTYDADVVVLLTNWTGNTCGLAYLMTILDSGFFAPYAFSVVDYSCATGYYSFGHEIGHNMGATHDIGNAITTPMYTYAYGYRDASWDFRTIMAYASGCGSPYCPRVNRWSNPNKSYNSEVTGTSTANNCQTLSNNAETTANMRASGRVGSLFDYDSTIRGGESEISADALASSFVYLPLIMKPLPIPCM